MSDVPAAAHPSPWWSKAVPRANRIYFATAVVATLGVFLLPHALGNFVACARYMEVDWLVVALLSMATIGFLNVLFSFLAVWEGALPVRVITPLRKASVVVLPAFALVAIVWFAVGAFIPALAHYPEVLCD
jgi:hypothetical protein